MHSQPAVIRRAPLRFGMVIALAAAAGCGSSATTSTNLSGPSNVRCQAAVSNSSSSFGPAGGSGTITVSVSRECSWSAAAQASWIAITSAREGQGDGTITYSVAANGDPVTRQGAVLVSDRQVAIGQAAAPCQFQVVPAQSVLAAAGGSMNVEVRTHAACAWTASSEVAWASLSPTSARGAGVVRVDVRPNESAAPRTMAIVVAGERITATQPGVGAPPGPGPAPPIPPTPPPVPEPVPVSSITLDGSVESAVSGTCPLIMFTLRERQVYTTAITTIRRGQCRDIQRGIRLEVSGTLMSDGRVQASVITLDGDDFDSGPALVRDRFQ